MSCLKIYDCRKVDRLLKDLARSSIVMTGNGLRGLVIVTLKVSQGYVNMRWKCRFGHSVLCEE